MDEARQRFCTVQDPCFWWEHFQAPESSLGSEGELEEKQGCAAALFAVSPLLAHSSLSCSTLLISL